MRENPARSCLVPHTDEHVEEVRQVNELIAHFLAESPSIDTEEGLAAQRANGGLWIAP